jgi:hypothetical protein
MVLHRLLQAWLYMLPTFSSLWSWGGWQYQRSWSYGNGSHFCRLSGTAAYKYPVSSLNADMHTNTLTDRCARHISVLRDCGGDSVCRESVTVESARGPKWLLAVTALSWLLFLMQYSYSGDKYKTAPVSIWVPHHEGRTYGSQPHRHLWAHCLDSVRSSTSHSPTGLHGLLLGWLYLFICRWCSYLTGNTRTSLHGLLLGWFY